MRDSLLGKTPNDWDITTSAKPEDMKSVFINFHCIDTGIKHGTVTVVIDGEPLEITTFRLDGEYEDNRHPKSVTFTSDLGADLGRRDFTVNAMAYSKKTGTVDLFGGQNDLKNKIIRCVATRTGALMKMPCESCAPCALRPHSTLKLRRKPRRVF